jgi:hypothetical protein
LATSVSVLTVLISVLSSATVGGIIVAVVTGRHERDQQLRDKMLTAAADFATTMAKLRTHLQRADQDESDGALTKESRAAALRTYDDLYEEAASHLIVIQMLYHPASATYGDAGKIWSLTPTPQEARAFLGDRHARDNKIYGGIKTAGDLNYEMNFSNYFAGHVWEAIDNPRRRRGRRSQVPGLAATLQRRPVP